MSSRALFIVSATILTCTPAWGEEWATKMFDTKSHDFGTIAAGAKAEFAFVVKNNFAKEVHIASVRSTCGCTDPRIENPTLQTYETGAIVASINSQRLRGRQGAALTVVIDRPVYAEVQLRVDVYIRGDVVLSPPSIDFGELRVGKTAEKELTVTRYGKRDWKVLEITSRHPNLSAVLEESERTSQRVSYRLKVQLDEKTPDGAVQEAITLITNDGEQQRIPVMVEGQVLPTISVAPRSLYLGVVAPGEEAKKQIVVRGEEPFRIVGITADREGFEFTVPESGEAKKLFLVPVRFKAVGDERAVKVVIRIETDSGRTVQLQAHVAVKPR